MVRSLEALKFWVSDQSRHQTQVVTRPKSSTDPKSSPSPSRHLTQVIDPSRRPRLSPDPSRWPKSSTQVVDSGCHQTQVVDSSLFPYDSCSLRFCFFQDLDITIYMIAYDSSGFPTFFFIFFSFLRTLWLVDGESYNRKIVRKSTPLFIH